MIGTSTHIFEQDTEWDGTYIFEQREYELS